jgi:nucleotide-binding universal stress UspA family protein
MSISGAYIQIKEVHMATVHASIAPSPVATLKNILFATDFSEASMKAFPYAASLAKKFGASVFACHIITPTSLATAAPQSAPYFYEAEYEAATKELDNIVHSPELEGIKTKALLSSGILGDALQEEIKQNHIDLIVAGTHGRTGLRRFLLGYAVEGICRVATCPVLTVGPDQPNSRIKLDNILVPTEPFRRKHARAAICCAHCRRIRSQGNGAARFARGNCEQSRYAEAVRAGVQEYGPFV